MHDGADAPGHLARRRERRSAQEPALLVQANRLREVGLDIARAQLPEPNRQRDRRAEQQARPRRPLGRPREQPGEQQPADHGDAELARADRARRRERGQQHGRVARAPDAAHVEPGRDQQPGHELDVRHERERQHHDQRAGEQAER
jgi:hypothetical protein